MNFLAHSFLSFGHHEILVGNMISDFVKGRKKFDYTEGIQRGIQLHRDIDTFTDAHQATKEAKVFLKSAVGLYAGAFIDVVYDHFLANDLTQFSTVTLEQHSSDTYNILQLNESLLPMQFRLMLPYMISQNWLYGYRTIPGIEKSFAGVARRAVYLESSASAFHLFQEHYDELQKCYKAFFPEVKSYAERQF